MLKRHWLWYATIACAVLILSGCCHDRLILRGDWSIGLDGSPYLGGCTAPGCSSGPVAHGHGGLDPALAAADENPLGATQHAKFHPVPTRPVFAPKGAIPVAQPIRRPMPTPATGPEPPAEELFLPKPAAEQVAYLQAAPPQSGTSGVQRDEHSAWFFEPAPQPPTARTSAGQTSAGQSRTTQSVMVPSSQSSSSQSVMIPSSAIKPAPSTSKTATTSGWRPRRTR